MFEQERTEKGKWQRIKTFCTVGQSEVFRNQFFSIICLILVQTKKSNKIAIDFFNSLEKRPFLVCWNKSLVDEDEFSPTTNTIVDFQSKKEKKFKFFFQIWNIMYSILSINHIRLLSFCCRSRIHFISINLHQRIS